MVGVGAPPSLIVDRIGTALPNLLHADLLLFSSIRETNGPEVDREQPGHPLCEYSVPQRSSGPTCPANLVLCSPPDFGLPIDMKQ